MKFSYLQYLTQPSPMTPSGILHRPKVPLRIVGGAGILPTWALVDPGSDDTLLPLSLGKLIGAKIDPTNTWQVEGISGQAVAVILGEVAFERTDGNQTFRWAAQVGFVDFADPKDEVTILGHAGFLDYFRATFDGHLRTLEIEVTPAFPGQVLQVVNEHGGHHNWEPNVDQLEVAHMKYSSFFWDEDDDPAGNVQHVAEHDLTVADVEEVLVAPVSEGHSNSSGFPAAWGYVPDGRFIIVIFEEIDDDTIRVITAYEVPEPKAKPRKKKRK